MNLKRPICFIDLETTGINKETDRIVEISVIKLFPNGNSENTTRRLNPTIPISPGASEVHGIKYEDVQNEKTFAEIAMQLYDYISDSDLAGYNALFFDFPILLKEFERCGIVWDYKQHALIDVYNIFKMDNPRNLAAAYKFYCNKELINAHSAEADTIATKEIFLKQIQGDWAKDMNIPQIAKYSNHDNELLDLSGKFTFNEEGKIIFTFGPHRNEPAEDHIDFVVWMYGRNFSNDTKNVCKKIIDDFKRK